MRLYSTVSRAALLALLVSAPAWAEGIEGLDRGITEIDPPEEFDRIAPNGSSDTGDVVTMIGSEGEAGNRAYIWTPMGGLSQLDALDSSSAMFPGTSTTATDISGDGVFAVGVSLNTAVRWNLDSDTIEELSDDTDVDRSAARGVNTDGSVIVGDFTKEGVTEGARGAFRWTEESGDFEFLTPGIANSVAFDVSGDGDTVVGEYSDYAFMWTMQVGVTTLPRLSEAASLGTRAFAVSDDGAVIAGRSYNAADESRAVIWQDGAITSLGVLPGFPQGASAESSASDVSGNGMVVVGSASNCTTVECGEGEIEDDGFRWTEETGMQTIYEWLEDEGIDVGEDAPGIAHASATNEDGSVVYGGLDNDNAFVATPEGLITLEEVLGSLLGIAQTGGTGTGIGSLLMNGAHSQPMLHYVPAGKFTSWVAGDYGLDDHGPRDGKIGLAEIGAGYNFGTVQLGMSLGYTMADTDTPVGGKVTADGKYAFMDVIWRMVPRGNIYATVSAFGQWGEIDSRRGYLNAGLPDASFAETDARVWGVRGRLDWFNALRSRSFLATPYVDLSHIRSKTDGYTETGGGFPASVAERKDDVTELRGGANMAIPTRFGVRFLGNVEAAYRFDEEGANVVGSTAVFAFNLPGQDYDQFWWKGGLGLDWLINRNLRMVVMGNATTEGSAPSFWGNTSLQMTF